MSNWSKSYPTLDRSRKTIISLLKQSGIVFLIFLFPLMGSLLGLGGWTIVASFILSGVYIIWTENETQNNTIQQQENSITQQEGFGEDPGILFGGIRHATKAFTKNTLIVGTVGSGKSVTSKLIAKDALAGIGGSVNKRALIYDPSREWPSVLEAMGLPEQAIIYTNPFDQRCRPWWISKDIKTPLQAEALAKALVPISSGMSDPFWIQATQTVIATVIRYFNAVAPEQWSLRDLLIAVRSQEIVSKMCADDPRLRHYSQVLGNSKTAMGIMASVVSCTQKYEHVAALWHKSETVYNNQPFSLKEWLNSSSILVLGRSETANNGLREINRVMLMQVKKLMLEQPEKAYPTTWMFLDEIDSLDGIEALLTAMTELRKRGVAIVGGLKTITHMVDNFNKSIVDTMMSQFGHIAALRQTDRETEEWLRNIAGKTEVRERYYRKGKNKRKTQAFREERKLSQGSLNGIPAFEPTLGSGMKGFYISPDKKWWHTYEPSIVQKLPLQGDPSRNFLKMPKEYQELAPWTTDDWQRLNILNLQGNELNAPSADGTTAHLPDEILNALKQETIDSLSSITNVEEDVY
ncbi:MAG: type IV secretion system DNA-binding domain-containing protein [Cyanobacteria bacterium J06634_5]